MITSVLPILQTALALGNLAALLYAFKKFLTKPQTTLEEQHRELEKRVTKAEDRIEDIQESLRQNSDNFKDQKDTNEMFITCLLAFIDYEISQEKDDLFKAKDTLQKYLAKR